MFLYLFKENLNKIPPCVHAHQPIECLRKKVLRNILLNCWETSFKTLKHSTFKNSENKFTSPKISLRILMKNPYWDNRRTKNRERGEKKGENKIKNLQHILTTARMRILSSRKFGRGFLKKLVSFSHLCVRRSKYCGLNLN